MDDTELDELTAGVPVPLDDDLYQRWVEAKQALDEVKAYFDGLDRAIRDHATEVSDGCDANLVVDGVVVGTYRAYVSHRVDTSRIKREFPDIAAQFTKTSKYWRLSWKKAES